MRVALVLLFGGLMLLLANTLSNDPEYISALQHRLSQPVDLLVGVGAIIAAGAMTYPFGRLLYRREA